ncbi:uncharacterized protein MKK02DRAFT_29747 [Dioszegia hungarica]|uniref:Uncharacterized protein n=1 Tax=Dioszegia hungarica TaxID=4972 RepID=A0AA38HI24_9TREE|nr:uncharacterized protein MKK02DRAFT_29747 [Dioszegia hungarica]KAI9639759.1 hypothetical protein MKK02DRAFT_29747 [Dioszegia hungarica]
MTVPGRIIRPIDQKTEYQWYIDQMNVNYNSVATLTEEERSSLTKHLPKIFGPFLSGESVDPETGRADLSCVVLVAVTANGELCGTITSILRETDSHPERRFIVRRSAFSEARTGPNGETPHEAILDVNCLVERMIPLEESRMGGKRVPTISFVCQAPHARIAPLFGLTPWTREDTGVKLVSAPGSPGHTESPDLLVRLCVLYIRRDTAPSTCLPVQQYPEATDPSLKTSCSKYRSLPRCSHRLPSFCLCRPSWSSLPLRAALVSSSGPCLTRRSTTSRSTVRPMDLITMSKNSCSYRRTITRTVFLLIDAKLSDAILQHPSPDSPAAWKAGKGAFTYVLAGKDPVFCHLEGNLDGGQLVQDAEKDVVWEFADPAYAHQKPCDMVQRGIALKCGTEADPQTMQCRTE